MKYVLIVLLALVSFNLVASDTGLFYDEERNGEGVLVMRDERLIVAYIFTYGARHCDYGPSISPAYGDYDCSKDGGRWFFLSDNWNGEDEEATGFLFRGVGVDWPDGISDPTDPFSVIVGEADPVGVYYMRPSGDGYQILIVPFGDSLDKDDPLYGRIHQYTTKLFEPLGVSPK